MSRPDFRTPRIFLDAPMRAGAEIALSREQVNYLVNVMRLEQGATVLVFNGRDGEWSARLAAASKREASLAVSGQTRPQPESRSLDYAFAPLKHARLDYMVQKAVELGASRLSPVLTQHTQVSRVNLDRMRANVIEAAEQCGVLGVAEVAEPLQFDRWLKELAPGRTLIFCDEGAETASPIEALKLAKAGAVTILIGPEGGFSEEEGRALLARPNVIRLSLGPRILRADTAGVAALAVVQAVLGDWR
jgi:16S rRNA (uracil1498-N3)-methyltransferase